jgi:hypothetical protein
MGFLLQFFWKQNGLRQNARIQKCILRNGFVSGVICSAPCGAGSVKPPLQLSAGWPG